MGATPDVIMRKLGYSLVDNMATEQQIKTAFAKAGYGPKKIAKWWDYYRSREVNLIRPVKLHDGSLCMNDKGQLMYCSEFWLSGGRDA